MPRAPSLSASRSAANFALRVAVRAAGAGIDLDRVVAVCPVLRPRNTMQALETGSGSIGAIFSSAGIARSPPSPAVSPGATISATCTGSARCRPRPSIWSRAIRAFPTSIPTWKATRSPAAPWEGLDVPTRIIAAEDDPVIPATDLADLARSSALSVSHFPHGGHCGFVAGYSLRIWLDEAIADLASTHDFGQ